MVKRGSRKAQITIFMIVGILIIGSIATYIYLKDRTTLFRPKELIPPELAPVKEMVEKCMTDAVEEASFLASSQGGYVELPQDIAQDPKKHIGIGFDIPLWYSDGAIRMPQLSDIEAGFVSYIVSTLDRCTLGFAAFQSQYDISELARPSVSIKINDREIVAQLKYPIQVKNKQSTKISNIEDFRVTIQDSLGRKYRLARSIFELEHSTGILENLTLEMISSSSLPYEGFELTCAKREWDMEADIKPQLKQLIYANMRFLTIGNTDTVQPESGYAQYYENFYKVRTSSEEFKDMSVRPIYDTKWPMSLDVYPNYAGKVRPANVNAILGTCFKVYNHKYTVVYPMLFQIEETTGEEPTYFIFGTEVVLERNEPNRISRVEPNLFRDPAVQAEYCNSRQHEMNIFAWDDFTGERLANASISYQCFKYICDMGETSVRRRSDGRVVDFRDFVLNAKFPSCGSALIIANKPGYVQATLSDIPVGEIDQNGYQLFTPGQQINIRLDPLKPFDYDIKEIVVDAATGHSTEQELDANANATIYISSKDREYQQIVTYPYGSSDDKLMFILSDDIYHVDIKVFEHGNWTSGAILDWGPGAVNVNNNNKIIFYVLRTDPLPKNDEEYSAFYAYIKQNSVNYLPLLSQG